MLGKLHEHIIEACDHVNNAEKELKHLIEKPSSIENLCIEMSSIIRSLDDIQKKIHAFRMETDKDYIDIVNNQE